MFLVVFFFVFSACMFALFYSVFFFFKLLFAFLFSKEKEKEGLGLGGYREGGNIVGYEGRKTINRIYHMTKKLSSINKIDT